MTAQTALAATASRAERVQRVVSPGGVEAWLVESYAVPLVALEFSLRGGAAQDPDGKPGLTTLLAGLLDEGAGPYDAKSFHHALDDLAIHIGFGADRDQISGHLQTLSRNTDEAFELLRLALVEPRLEAEAIARVRSQLASELKREVNDPDAMAAKAFREAAFPGHVYGRPVRGELSSIDSLRRDDLDALRARLFSTKDLKIAVVGAIDAKALAARLDQTFGAWSKTNALAPVADIAVAGVGKRLVTNIDIPQSAMRFGRPGVPKTDPDYFAAVVANHIFGGGTFTSRLFQEVREKRGLTYSVYTQLNEYDHCPMLIGGNSTKNERAGESLKVILEEARRFVDDGPTAEELDKAKKFLVGSYALRFDTSTKIASQLVNVQLDGHAPNYLDERNARIEAVGLEDVTRAGRKLLGDGDFLVAVAGRPEGL